MEMNEGKECCWLIVGNGTRLTCNFSINFIYRNSSDCCHLVSNLANCKHFLIAEPLNVLVACGPYTPSDSLTFDPLLDLMNVIVRDGPDVCLLV